MVFDFRKSLTATARIGFRLRRTVRYVSNLLVWSRVFRARRGLSPVSISAAQRAHKGVMFAQPELQVTERDDDGRAEDGFRAVYDTLFANLQTSNLTTPYRSALPGPAFSGIYLWDSAFISLIWNHWDVAVAQDVLRSVLAARDGDRLRHVVSDFSQSVYTQPPLVAWAAAQLELPSAHARRVWFAEVYPTLKAYHEWLKNHRRLENGLFFWEHPYESGVENAPRFGPPDERTYRDTRNVAAPDFCTYLVLQAEALATMAAEIDPDAVAGFEQTARDLRERVNAELWHEADGLYYDRTVDGEWICCASIASVLPLAAGIPDAPRAARLREAVADPARFGSRMPLPSVAINDPQFARDMWCGPVWLNTAYLAVEGLRRYGFHDLAAAVSGRLVTGVYEVLDTEHNLYEFYDPEQPSTADLWRKRGNLWKHWTLGSKPQRDFVGWTGLVNTLVLRFWFGLRWTDGEISTQPRFPESACGAKWTLAVPQWDLHLSAVPDCGGPTQLAYKVGLRAGTATIHPGETLVLH